MPKCPYCSVTTLNTYININNINVYTCDKCDLLFTDINQSSQNSVNTKKYNEYYLNSYESIRSTTLIPFFNKVKRDILHYKKCGNLLDVGCSTGLFLRNFQVETEKNWLIRGIDINSLSIKLAKKLSGSISYSTQDIKQLLKDKCFYDCITCLDVLEHNRNLKGNLEVIGRLLKKSGLLIIQVPNYKSIMAKFTAKEWDWWCVPDHVLHLSLKFLKKALTENNFKIIYVETRDDKVIFLKNCYAVFKKRINNKLLAKLLYFPFIFILLLVMFSNKWLNKGALIYCIARKI